MTEEEKELKEEIARKEKQLADFVRLGAFIDLSEEEKEKRRWAGTHRVSRNERKRFRFDQPVWYGRCYV